MREKLTALQEHKDTFIDAKKEILKMWLSYSAPKKILLSHSIEPEHFCDEYAGGVFDYFIGVIAGEVEIGNCPVMQSLLSYLKDREISADELFEICSHFKRAMVDFTYDKEINSKKVFNELSYIFGKNFQGILKYYTDTIFQRLIDARAEALKAGQAKEYFLSNMSHEIRTPLNAVLGFVNLLLEDDINQKHRNYLEIIRNSGENLLSIINSILDFSKLRSGEFTIEPKIFTLHDEISHTMELFVASANSKNITITSFIDPTIPKELYGDALRIKQILSNLISNAIKFSPEGGVIHIEASCEDSILKIGVRDNGVGISSHNLKKIFTAFTQAEENDPSKNFGTGLGLSICQQLAEHMHGVVKVESELGKGSHFWMEIPVDVHTDECQLFDDMDQFAQMRIVLFANNKELKFQHKSFLRYSNVFGINIEIVDTFQDPFDVAIFVHEELDEKLKEELKNSQKKCVALMGKLSDEYNENKNIVPLTFPLYCAKIRTAFLELLNPTEYHPHLQSTQKQFKGHILIAEDNEANQELIKILLSKYGLTYDLAANGLEAYELYQKNKYNLILMDEQMPVMDGNEAVAKILAYEKEHAMHHTPISAITANVIKGARERGLSSGFDSFLGKPIILKELERVLANYLPELSADNVVVKKESESKKIKGIDIKKLGAELMLNPEELTMLLTLFVKKMEKYLPELKMAIKERDYKKIALIAHGIKGSSGNFRIEVLQEKASEMEKMAKNKDTEYSYDKTYVTLRNKIEEIEIE
ncbi:MAG: ATP-binding protein [Sulfurimonas sp.]|jgi:signal transduction histidine kinase/CheY-like chemotaxis protein/HPt (histidine-containing phosphotransfer) domain-containing protein|nr:ATP-binding protein [Sulfurimonas sp.]